MLVFDLDALISGAGSDYALDDIPAMDCPGAGCAGSSFGCPSPTRRRRRKSSRAL